MRKILSLLAIFAILFSLSSCDGMIDFMGKMGQNVMGMDTSKATQAVESAKVPQDKLEKKDTLVTEDGTEATIKIGDASITISSDTVKDVDKILPEIEPSVVSDIAAATKNSESTAVLVEEMSKPVEDEVKEAAKGTATIMYEVLDTYKNKISAAVDDNEIAGAVNEAISSLSESLATIVKIDETISSGDVVTLQLIQSFATDVASAVDIDTGEIQEDKLSDLISSANTLATVTSSLSSASKFNLDLSSIISGVMNAMPRSRALTEEEAEENINDIESYDLTPYAGTIRSVYKSISAVAGKDAASFKRNVLSLSLHKAAYETYVNIIWPTVNKLTGQAYVDFTNFKTFDGLLKYTMASALSELDRYYKIILNDKEFWTALNGTNFPLEKSELPENVWMVVEEIVAENEWITNSHYEGKCTFSIPEKYEVILKAIMQYDTEEVTRPQVEDFVNEVNRIITNDLINLPTVSALKTLQKMVNYVNLDSITSMVEGDVDFVQDLQDAINFFETGIEMGE